LDGCKSFLKSQRFPPFLNFAFPIFMGRGFLKKSRHHGIAVHSPQEIFHIYRKTLKALDDYLGWLFHQAYFLKNFEHFV
jgi:hypothetical protein